MRIFVLSGAVLARPGADAERDGLSLDNRVVRRGARADDYLSAACSSPIRCARHGQPRLVGTTRRQGGRMH
jgi:hypothetical protein